MTPITRRSFLQTSVLTVAAAHLGPRTLFAEQEAAVADKLAQMRASAAGAKITTQALRGNVSALLGNIAVLPGKDGKLLVDSGFSTSRPQIAEALAALGPEPPTLLINTHWHFDHTDGNAWMHAAGAEIVAHEKTRERLSTTQHIADYDLTVPPSPAGALPTQLMTTARTLDGNGETLTLTHYDPAHTDTDVAVLFAHADVLHTGDTWFNGIYPFVDYSSGGSIDGMIRATERNLGVATAKTIILPGHGPVGTREQLLRYRDMLVGSREKIAALKRQGKSVAEIAAAKPTAAFDGEFKPLGAPDFFIKLVYEGV